MAYTPTDIANLAMAHLGDREIADIDDTDDPDSAILNRHYDHARDVVYEAHDWRWAKKAVQLQRKPGTPTTQFTYIYGLPPNYRRMSNVSEFSSMDPVLDYFSITDRELVADAESVYMEYVSSEWSEAVWPAYFAECVGVKLAETCAMRISHNRNAKAELMRMFQRETLPYARSIDSQGQPAQRHIIRSPWTRAKFGSRNRGNLYKNA